MASANRTTSWGPVAAWYNEHLESISTYHERLILPNISRMAGIVAGNRVLDLACGQGIAARKFAALGTDVTGCDISKELIDIAKSASPGMSFHVAPADDLSFAKKSSFDVVVCILALQNMKNIRGVFAECARVLTDKGRAYFVINHPSFRIPKTSSWGFDVAEKIQYRRIEQYMSDSEVEIDMHPGATKKRTTTSFHRPLQVYVKALRNAGLAISNMEEWISDKESISGPRADAENHARKEIPLFMALEVKKLS